MTKIICGVDVSSETLNAHIRPNVGRVGPFERTAEGIEALAATCREHGVELVVMEATGGYERQPFKLLWMHGVPCAIVNPRHVRLFAQGMGVLEKTDDIDAEVIGHFAEVRGIVAEPPADGAQERLADLVKRLQQLTDMRTVQINQRRLMTRPEILASINEVVATINRQIRAFETQIAALIDADPLWKRLDAAFRTIKGVADRTVARVMAQLPEIGTLSNKAISKLVGVAPLADDSGKKQGRRSVRGGRQGVRDILFLVAEVVRRYEPDFREFHRRLSEAGKPKKVIRIALAHKLLVRMNAKAREIRAATPIRA